MDGNLKIIPNDYKTLVNIALKQNTYSFQSINTFYIKHENNNTNQPSAKR